MKVFGRLGVVALAALSVSGCVFDLSGDEPKAKVRAVDACPPRDEANWARMQAVLETNKAKDGFKVTESANTATGYAVPQASIDSEPELL